MKKRIAIAALSLISVAALAQSARINEFLIKSLIPTTVLTEFIQRGIVPAAMMRKLINNEKIEIADLLPGADRMSPRIRTLSYSYRSTLSQALGGGGLSLKKSTREAVLAYVSNPDAVLEVCSASRSIFVDALTQRISELNARYPGREPIIKAALIGHIYIELGNAYTAINLSLEGVEAEDLTLLSFMNRRKVSGGISVLESYLKCVEYIKEDLEQSFDHTENSWLQVMLSHQ